jgi:DNA-binding ferritin-like protein (Dps family)
MQQLLQQHAQRYTVGIHPSWQSGDDDVLLKDEIITLQNIIQQTVKYSRQHYIRMSLPKTYQKLIEQGIEAEYSMGYGSINGFRASYTLPFKWYDLQKELQTNLTIHPFCYMEANSFFEQKLTIDEAAAELQSYYNIVKKVNGHFITIFHNHFLTEQKQWIAWRNMYENFLHSNFEM